MKDALVDCAIAFLVTAVDVVVVRRRCRRRPRRPSLRRRQKTDTTNLCKHESGIYVNKSA